MKTIEQINALMASEAQKAKEDELMMIANGWAINPKPKGFRAYVKGDFHVWELRNGWQFAELKHGAYFTGHTKFTDLESVIKYSIA